MRLNNYNCKSVIKNMPITFAHHKVVFDENKNPIDFIFLDINKKFEEFTGLKREEVINKKATNVLEDIAQNTFDWIEVYGEIALNGGIKSFEKYFESLESWYKVQAYSQKKGHFTTLFNDITEKKDREKEMSYIRERYQNIYNSAPIGIIIEDENGKIVEVNDVVCDMTGYSKKELEDSDVKDKLVLPEYRENAKENIKEIIGGEDKEFDIKTLTKNGEIKESHLRETNITLPDGKKGIISMYLDITERKKLEKELKEKNNLFNSILESIQDGISVLNSDLTIRYTNSTMKKWYKNNLPIKGEICYKGYYGRENECKECPVIKSLETGEMESHVKELPEEFDLDFIEIFSYPIWDKNKENITGIVEFVRDISESKKQRKKLEMMNFTVNKSNLLIFQVNPEGIIEYINDTVLDKLGYERRELIDKDTVKLIKTDNYIDREKFWNKIKNSKVITYERKFKTKSGDCFPAEITSQYFNYEDKEYEFVFARDITERKRKQEKIRGQKNKLKKQKDRMKYILESTDTGTWEWNVQTGKTIFNKKWAEMIGYTLEEISPTTFETWKKFTHPEDREKSEEMLKKHFNGEIDQYEIEIRMKHKNGHWIWVLDKGKVVSWTDDGQPLRMFGIHLNITERKKKEKKIKHLSYKDNLTNLYNRRYFEEKMKHLDTESQLPISVIMADVNGLKIINDTYGHSVGDDLLIKTSEILNNSIRKEDILARWAGDEFVILLPKTAKEKALKIMKSIKNKNKKLSEEKIPISIGMGVSTKNKMDQSLIKVLEKADDRMYQNKLSESRSASNKIVQNLLNTLGTKSSETKEHAIRMTNSAQKLGEKLGLSNSEMNKLSLLATLHDIGKTTISEKILTKPGKLTENEWQIMKEHPERGYKIASASDEFVLVAEEILSHHEHWDGNGYPRELEGEDIPYLARIISIIDAYDVMTSERPYSKAISNEKALEEIKNCAGSQFDPKLAQEFIELKS